ncbi:beta-lactamase-like protein [Echria macrotheca]|uniref:Protein artemis n=1 Tax=Echria macrotheca TaxID=438768 RepID=A0AAJ0BLX4_9PEZI|nr:beta-lactamase-like protein [Echria macrotheca]
MSTFNGIVDEFPEIRVDFFRNTIANPPLACFLSHIHSDHLAGLENLRSPFVYCSAATREMLLRLERFPCRINYAKGILEARIQTYKHLKSLLKPLPLETSTVLELAPGNHLQVTLFDANHCPGAVMFLFEGHGKAVLYTGDIRSEPWFVNAIARSPSLIQYTSGLKTIDTIYLDTSFIDGHSFPSKAEGISELLEKVTRYPENTIFHFQAWTYGYEDVWVALCKALGTKVHVDEYKMLIYRSLVAKDATAKFGTQFHLSPEAPGLMGFMCGNTYHPGCLTLDRNVRLHSCERGNYCQTVLQSKVVRIQPVITRLPGGQEIAELGVGGGGDDLNRDAELDYILPTEIEQLVDAMCDDDDSSHELKEQLRGFLMRASGSGRKIPLDLEMATFGEGSEIGLRNAFQALAKKSHRQDPIGDKQADWLPDIVTFPYSRHSSYPELCHLVEIFKPKDIWPCTVDPKEWVEKGITIEGLFGRHASAKSFQHDILMDQMARESGVGPTNDSQATSMSSASSIPYVPQHPTNDEVGTQDDPISVVDEVDLQIEAELRAASQREDGASFQAQPPLAASEDPGSQTAELDSVYMDDSQDSTLSDFAYHTRLSAFQKTLRDFKNNTGTELGLLSTTDGHSKLELDLGNERGR